MLPRRWRCDNHPEGPVFMSSPHQPVCWCCTTPMVDHGRALTIVDTPYRNPRLADIAALGGTP